MEKLDEDINGTIDQVESSTHIVGIIVTSVIGLCCLTIFASIFYCCCVVGKTASDINEISSQKKYRHNAVTKPLLSDTESCSVNYNT